MTAWSALYVLAIPSVQTLGTSSQLRDLLIQGMPLDWFWKHWQGCEGQHGWELCVFHDSYRLSAEALLSSTPFHLFSHLRHFFAPLYSCSCTALLCSTAFLSLMPTLSALFLPSEELSLLALSSSSLETPSLLLIAHLCSFPMCSFRPWEKSFLLGRTQTNSCCSSRDIRKRSAGRCSKGLSNWRTNARSPAATNSTFSL